MISGLIGVAGSDGAINAGMCGDGNAYNAVRFWAGANAENRANAPYQVWNDGTNIMDKAIICSSSYIQGILYNKVSNLNKDNFASYCYYNVIIGKYIYNLKKFGGNIFFEDDTSLKNVSIDLPKEYFKSPQNSMLNTSLVGEAIDFIDKVIVIRRGKKTTVPFSLIGSTTTPSNLFTLFAKCIIYEDNNNYAIGFVPMAGFDNNGVGLLEYFTV